MTEFDQLGWTAQADAWQAEGRLRAPFGGGVLELPGARLMSSGLPQAQWNSGDMTDAARVPLAFTPAASAASRIVCPGRTATRRRDRRSSTVIGASPWRRSGTKRSLRTRPAAPCRSATARTASISRAGPQT